MCLEHASGMREMRTAQAVQILAGKRERKVSLWGLWSKEDNSKWNVTTSMLYVV